MLILFLLLNAQIAASSFVVAYRFMRGSAFSEQLVTAFLVAVSQISLTLLFLGVIVKILDLPFIVLLNTAVSTGILFFLRKDIKNSFKHFYQGIGRFSGQLVRERDYFLYLILLLFGTQVVFLVVKIYYLPPQVWDVFTYHLHPVVEWFQQNKIPAAIDTPVLRANANPLGGKLFHFWFIAFFRHLTLVELPQFFYGLVLATLSYCFIRKFQTLRSIALKYALLIYFIPTVLIQSRTCQDHLTLTVILLFALFYIINIFYESKPNQVFFLALALGMLISIKQNSLQIIIVLFLAFPLSRGFKLSRITAFIKDHKYRLLSGLALVGALGGYWFFRNTILINKYLFLIPRIFSLKIVGLTIAVAVGFGLLHRLFIRGRLKKSRVPDQGNNRSRVPTYITIAATLAILISVSFFVKNDKGETFFSTIRQTLSSQQDMSGTIKDYKSNFVKNLLVFPLRIKDTGGEYSPDMENVSGFGIQFFVFGLFAYLLSIPMVLFKKQYRTGVPGIVTIFSGLLLGSYFIYYFTPYNYRMFLFFPVFGIILWAFILSRLQLKKYVSYYLDVLMVIMILFNMAVCGFEGNLRASGWKAGFTMENGNARTGTVYSPLLKGEDWRYIDNCLPPGEVIGYYGCGDSWVFPYFDIGMTRKARYLGALPGFAVKKGAEGTRVLEFPLEFKESLKQENIRYIHINPQGCTSREKITIAESDPNIKPIVPNLYYVVY
ncbi:MAG: hypothetical protein GY765_12490 [bacterium]|nr:hypothetical protein [bacterium]